MALLLPERSLLVGLAWVEAHCVIPDHEQRGEAFILGDEQASFLATHYEVKAKASPSMRGDAFVYRRSQLVRAQKWGKSPLVSAQVCLEGVGPALFAGWAAGGETYSCSSHGCGCGWVYVYEPGEAMGRPWSTALIQITATSEDQTDNTYDALRPMIELGPLSDVIRKTGEEFIRLPNGGRIDAVTSKATSRLGQRVTFVPQDETGLWVESNGGHNLAKKQRQGLAGMGGRAVETTNPWNPAEDSVAQRTYETSAPDVYKDYRQPPANLSFKNKRDRRKIFEFNYAASPWVPIDQIEAEAFEMLEHAPADAERFFGNRVVSGDGSWMDMAKWSKRVGQITVQPRTKVGLGFDGSDNDDHTGIRLETLDFHQFTPVYGPSKRETRWNPREWDGRIPRSEVSAAVRELASEFEIVRGYFDPEMWETEIDLWASEFGEKTLLKWPTNKVVAMHAELERFRNDVYNPDSGFSHDGNEGVAGHIQNAVMRARGLDPATKVRRYILGKPNDNQKIDDAMSSTLAHAAVCDAIAAGANQQAEDEYVYI